MAQEENHKMVIKVSDNGKKFPLRFWIKYSFHFLVRNQRKWNRIESIKQIMLLHKGNIHIASKEHVGTTVELVFPKMAES